MAGATSGEPANLETFADICCTLMLACERAGDSERPQQWSAVLDEFVRAHDHVTLLAFCRTCCADVYAADGRIDAAEAELEAAVHELAAAGQRSRCIPPSARLAEIRVQQGRFDEAEQLLEGLEGEAEAVQARVALRLARGDMEAAAAILLRRIDELGWDNSSQLLCSRNSCRRVSSRGMPMRPQLRRPRSTAIGSVPGRERVVALAVAAHGRIARAEGREDAVDLLLDGREPVRGARRSSGCGANAARARTRTRRDQPRGGRRHCAPCADGARRARRRARRGRGGGADALARREGRPRRTAGGRPPQPARDRGVATARRRALQSRDRRASLHQPEDGRAPRQPRLREARRRARARRLLRTPLETWGPNRGDAPTARRRSAQCSSGKQRKETPCRSS